VTARSCSHFAVQVCLRRPQQPCPPSSLLLLLYTSADLAGAAPSGASAAAPRSVAAHYVHTPQRGEAVVAVSSGLLALHLPSHQTHIILSILMVTHDLAASLAG
jgi:hypothetical protein